MVIPFRGCSLLGFQSFLPLSLSPLILFFLHYFFVVFCVELTKFFCVLPSELFDSISYYAKFMELFYVLPSKLFIVVSRCAKLVSFFVSCSQSFLLMFLVVQNSWSFFFPCCVKLAELHLFLLCKTCKVFLFLVL